MIVSFDNYELEPRYDNLPWTTIRIEESATETGTYVQIDEFPLDPLDTNPAFPIKRSFTTDNATLNSGWYKVSFLDSIGNIQTTDPVYNAASVEIMATLDDINGYLDGTVISADSNNSNLVQIGAARMIRAYLSSVVDSTTLMSWSTPELTPETIREIASLLIASQVFYNAAASTSSSVEDIHYAQRLYDRAMDMLNKIVSGEIIIGADVVVEPVDHISGIDFFPTDDTDRAFTMGMEL